MVMKYIMCGYSNVDFTIYGVLKIKVWSKLFSKCNPSWNERKHWT